MNSRCRASDVALACVPVHPALPWAKQHVTSSLQAGRITCQSSGRPPAGFASLRPPLTFDVMPQAADRVLAKSHADRSVALSARGASAEVSVGVSLGLRAIGNVAAPSQRLVASGASLLHQRNSRCRAPVVAFGQVPAHPVWPWATTAPRLFASGRSHNLSVKRTSSGWLRQPTVAAYLQR